MKRFLKTLRRTFIVLVCIVAVFTITTYFYMKQPQFGALPKGERLSLVKKSPNYKNGKFRNTVEKPIISEGYSIWKESYNTLFKDYPNREPVDVLPSVKTNLKNIPLDSNVIVWFGHSSFFLQV